jgi:ribosomal-protein-alanine N-acetyltransferase
MDIPTMTTRRLTLRPFREEDAPIMAQLLADPEVLRYFPGSGPVSLERAQRMVSSVLTHWQERGYGLWAVTCQEDGALLGRCGLQYLAEIDGVEVDFILGKSYWNQGYATEAGLASVQYGFDVLQLSRIAGIVHVDNLASQRVLQKLDMVRQKQARFFGIDCYQYELGRPEGS